MPTILLDFSLLTSSAMMMLALRPDSSGGISEPRRPYGAPGDKDVLRGSGPGLFSLLISILGATGDTDLSGLLTSGV